MSRPSSWKELRLRAKQLREERSHAAELLAFYGELLELQEALYTRAGSANWLNAATATAGVLPRLRVERLPTQELLPRFQSFLADVRIIATDVLASIAQSLETSSSAAQRKLLQDFLARKSPDNLPTTFFPRAYLQPLVRAVAEQCDAPPTDHVSTTCPLCGWPPQIGVIRDEIDIKGRRLLICSLCGHWWSARRALCAKCLEAHADKLIYHESDSVDYMRIEECTSCGYYMKSVDLRKNGNAVPEVDDVGSVELDLWAQERGLLRIQRNVLGL